MENKVKTNVSLEIPLGEIKEFYGKFSVACEEKDAGRILELLLPYIVVKEEEE